MQNKISCQATSSKNPEEHAWRLPMSLHAKLQNVSDRTNFEPLDICLKITIPRERAVD